MAAMLWAEMHKIAGMARSYSGMRRITDSRRHGIGEYGGGMPQNDPIPVARKNSGMHCRKIPRIGIRATVLALTLFSSHFDSAWANDTVAEITPNGLIFAREENISIEREDLYLSPNKIEVAYRFRNHSDNEIAVEIAFPIPVYDGLTVYNSPFHHYPLSFNDFDVEVEGRKIRHKQEVRAYLSTPEKREITALLIGMGLSIEDFAGLAGPHANDRQIRALSEEQLRQLVQMGAIVSENDSFMPNWQVSVNYHWRQIFPPNSTTTIKHRYAPYLGGYYVYFQKTGNGVSGEISENSAKESCLAPQVHQAIEDKMRRRAMDSGTKGARISINWLSYILTTANNWQRPIGEFHLTLERPADTIMSLCFGPKLRKTSPTTFEADVQNFVPEHELRVFFYWG